jgi:hypothetical protein
MSYALVVYRIPHQEIQSLLGSGNLDFLDEMERQDEGYCAGIDSIFDEDTWEGERPTCRQALTQMLQGGPYRDDADNLYIFAFEGICRVRGHFLDNRAFQPPIRWGWIETVDRFLQSIGFPLRVAQLAAGGAPFDFPHREAIPSIGHWPHEPLAAALDVLVNYRLDGVPSEVAEALATIIGWLDEALKHDDDILVGIYS